MQEKIRSEQMQAAHKRWQAARREEMASADSWLGLIGLFWLEPGRNALGHAAQSVIQLPDGADWQGDVCWEGERLLWQPAVGEPIVLQTDLAGQPSTVDLENYRFFVVDREGRLAVRLRDRQWATKQAFAGLDYFPYDPAWCIEATWETLAEPLRMEVPNVSGDLKLLEVRQQAAFSLGGEKVMLLPMSVGKEEVFFVLRDRTSGKESYGAGRFLKAKPAVDGKISLDFNFVYNPPCAFTPFATCPLPPAENWLPFAVSAGEKKYQAGDH